jgi:hypothetical protein
VLSGESLNYISSLRPTAVKLIIIMDNQPEQLVPTRFIDSMRFMLFTLIAANLLTIYIFIASHGSVFQALWSYWLQSVIIGAINVIRIMTMPIQGDATIGKMQNKVLRAGGALFFSFHYGMFHLVYAIFLVVLNKPDLKILVNGSVKYLHLSGSVNTSLVLLCGVAFALHHAISFVAERSYYKQNPESLQKAVMTMAAPYARIIPMHIIIILGPVVAVYTNNNNVFIVFMVLKGVADVALFRRGTGHPKTSVLNTPITN